MRLYIVHIILLYMMDTEPLFNDQYRIATARLRGYDYGQNGAYFVTICTQGRVRYFGEIEVPGQDWNLARLRPTPLAEVAAACWQQIPARFPFVVLDAFVIMPDHVHGLLLIDKPAEAAPPLYYENHFASQRDNLAAIVRGYKAGVTSQAQQAGLPFQWQPRFHDRVVRNSQEMERIQNYILTNPSRWQHEQFGEESLFR